MACSCRPTAAAGQAAPPPSASPRRPAARGARPCAQQQWCSRQHLPPDCSSGPSQQRRRRAAACGALDPLAAIASTDPSALQDVIVGGAVTAAVGAALFSGLKKEPVPCELCAGNGGIRCFACGGSGDLISKDILLTTDEEDGSQGEQRAAAAPAAPRPPRRDPVGRSTNPRACRVCKGTGLVLCSKCKGTGYQSTF